MDNEDDKYPGTSGRRRFVKGVVGSAALAGVGTATGAMVNTTTNPSGAGGGTTPYIGIENTDGPAPRAMPMIPLEFDDEGYLQGVFPEWEEVTEAGRTFQTATTEIGGVTYGVEWFQYCGVQSYGGIQADSNQDNYFRYADSPYEWQSNEVSTGDRMHIDDFTDYETWGNGIGRSGLGKPAMGTWRSQDVEDILPVQVLRIPPDMWGEISSDNEAFTEAASTENFIAWLGKCTHFCCVPGFKTTAQSAQFGGENEVYCPCHQSLYDPYSHVEKTFVALPRPN